MLLRLFGLLFTDPSAFLRLLVLFLLTGGVALVVGITVHEFSHALVATRLGDETARRRGRLTLNPLAHLDPVGTLMLVVVGFGWGRPVPINPWAFGRNALRYSALVALAGPLSNLLTALVASLPVRAGLLEWRSPLSVRAFLFHNGADYLATLIGFVVLYNLVLAIFNLIPLAPLDGSRVLQGFVPREMGYALARLERWGPGILMAVIFLDIFTGLNLLGRALWPAVNALSEALTGRAIY